MTAKLFEANPHHVVYKNGLSPVDKRLGLERHRWNTVLLEKPTRPRPHTTSVIPDSIWFPFASNYGLLYTEITRAFDRYLDRYQPKNAGLEN